MQLVCPRNLATFFAHDRLGKHNGSIAKLFNFGIGQRRTGEIEVAPNLIANE